MKTTAVDGGNNYVFNGDVWYIPSANVCDIAVMMAKTDPEAPRHRQLPKLIVELPNSGFKIRRNIATMHRHTSLGERLGAAHCEIDINHLIIPKANLLGGRGRGFDMDQYRLGYGRLRHGMHNIAKAQ